MIKHLFIHTLYQGRKTLCTPPRPQPTNMIDLNIFKKKFNSLNCSLKGRYVKVMINLVPDDKTPLYTRPGMKDG